MKTLAMEPFFHRVIGIHSIKIWEMVQKIYFVEQLWATASGEW